MNIYENESFFVEFEKTILTNANEVVETKYDKMLQSIMSNNQYLEYGVQSGHWLTRVRKMKNSKQQEPYIGVEIGMKPPKGSRINCTNRWGQMLYLSTDLTGMTGVKEARIPQDVDITIGYFFVKEDLKLFNATKPSAIADTRSTYGEIPAEIALYVLVKLIHKWMNASVEASDYQVYKITNYIAKLVRECSNLDGVIYRSTKNENYWNVALQDEKKVRWDYSVLAKPDNHGKYHEYNAKFSDDCISDVAITRDMLAISDVREYPKQMRNIFDSSFPFFLK